MRVWFGQVSFMMGLQGFWGCFDSHDGKDLVLGAHHVNGSWWVSSKFGYCNFLIHILSCTAPLLQRNRWAHKKMSWRNPTKHRTVSSEKIWRKAFSWFFFSRSDLPFFHSSPESHGLDAFVDQVVVMLLERGKKKKKKKRQMLRKSKISVELETDAKGRKRYGFFCPWIFNLPSVSHPYKNRRQQEILNLERRLSQPE